MIRLEFTNGVDPYDLTWEGSIYFGKVQLGEEKKIAVILKNTDEGAPCYDVKVQATMHPTDQVGPAAETYEACLLSLTENGDYTETLEFDNIGAGSETIIWLKWTIKEQSIPGIMRFAIKVTGRYTFG